MNTSTTDPTTIAEASRAFEEARRAQPTIQTYQEAFSYWQDREERAVLPELATIAHANAHAIQDRLERLGGSRGD